MRKLVGGLVAGLSATLLMEYASTFLYQRQSAPTPERKEELREELPTTVLVRRAARALGRELGEG